MLELLERKYESRRPDLVVTSTSVGLEFLLSTGRVSSRASRSCSCPSIGRRRPGSPFRRTSRAPGCRSTGRPRSTRRSVCSRKPARCSSWPGPRVATRSGWRVRAPSWRPTRAGGDPVHVSGDARAGAPDGGGAAGRRHRAGRHLSPGFRGQGLHVPGGGREDRPGIAGSSLRRARDPGRCWSGGRPRAQSRPRRREGGPPRVASAGR